MDKKYWENYYNNVGAERKPSLFAQHVLDNYLKEGQSIIELGCGNGRDCLYFANHGLNVLATDQCEAPDLKENLVNENLKFLATDFTKLDDLGEFNVVYSRFTLHSITEEQEDKVIAWSHRNLSDNGYLCIEARGHKNEIFKLGEPVPGQSNAFIYNDHYRRFVNREILINKLTNQGFHVVTQEEKKGFAPHNGTDYTFLRIIATKK
ncbi:MAG: class I SAM-dependent methyltransferase [Candidatus Paceibacterota bacterium]